MPQVYREVAAAALSSFVDAQEAFVLRFIPAVKGIIIAALVPVIGEKVKDQAKSAMQLLRSELPEKLQAFCDLDKLVRCVQILFLRYHRQRVLTKPSLGCPALLKIPQYISEQMDPRLNAVIMESLAEVGDPEAAAATEKLFTSPVATDGKGSAGLSTGTESRGGGALTILGAMSGAQTI